MYNIDTDVALPVSRGTTFQEADWRNVPLSIMGLAGPFSNLHGSFLDLEEVLDALLLPSSPAGWQYAGKNEWEIGAALASVYGSFAKMAHDRLGLTNEAAVQIGAKLFGVTLRDETPLQAAVTSQTPLSGATQVAISGASSYSGDINGTVLVDGTTVEAGRHRVVLRKELFEGLVSTRTTAARNSVPWVADIQLQVQGPELVVNTVVGTPVEGDEITWTGGSALLCGINGTTWYLAEVDGTPAGALTLSGSGATASVTSYDATADLLAAPVEIQEFNSVDQYPNCPDSAYFTAFISNLSFWPTLETQLLRASYKASGSRQTLRVDNGNPIGALLYALQSYAETFGQGHFTLSGSTVSLKSLTAGTIAEQLKAAGLPH